MTEERKLAIAFVTIADLPEGWGRTARLRTLAGALAGMGHRVVIWNEHNLESAGTQQVSGMVQGARYEYVLGSTQRERGFRAIALKLRAVRIILEKARQAARSGQLDVVIFNNLSFYDTFPITRLAQRLGVPTIQCYEDERFELVVREGGGLGRRVFGLNSWAADHWCSRMAGQIWVISSYLREKYSRLSGHPERVQIVPTIIDCRAWSLPPEPVQIPVILYSGGFGEHEDIEKLTRALGFLKQWKVEFRMRFLGADPGLPRVRQLKALARELQLEDSIHMQAFCPAAVVKQEVARANILVNLRNQSIWSRSGLSTKLSEYLAAGRTVLTTDIGDNARYVEHGKSAIVVSPEAPAEQVARLLQEVIERPEWRRQLGEGARQAALAHFDIPVVQEQLAEALESLDLKK